MEIYQSQLQVRHHECGPDRLMRLSLILDILQDAAAEHADRLGCGLEALQENSAIWVLSRLKLIFHRRPALGEKLTITTYPTGVDKLFALREYRLTNEADELLLSGTSGWLVLDRETLHPQRPGKMFAFLENSDLPVTFPKLDKLEERKDPVKCGTYAIGSSMIDMNEHLNNAYYSAFVQDALGTADIAGLQLNFLHGCLERSCLETFRQIEDKTAYICGIESGSGKLSFQAEAMLK